VKNVQPNITTHLQLSKNTGRAIHIKLKYSPDYFITCIMAMNDGQVIINPVSLHGGIIPITSFAESEVEVARCLNVSYNAPFYDHLRMIKSNIRLMKEQINTLGKY
jgi:hypothetical protein